MEVDQVESLLLQDSLGLAVQPEGKGEAGYGTAGGYGNGPPQGHEVEARLGVPGRGVGRQYFHFMTHVGELVSKLGDVRCDTPGPCEIVR